jgi:hypothetical protein
MFVIDKLFELTEQKLQSQDELFSIERMTIESINLEEETTRKSFGEIKITEEEVVDKKKEDLKMKEEKEKEFETKRNEIKLDIDNLEKDLMLNNSIEIENSTEIMSKTANKFIDYKLINKLFSFLETQQELNYVLCGYFLKVFTHLSNYRNNQLMTYLLVHKKQFIQNLLLHLNRKSICDCLLKVFVSYQVDIQDQELKVSMMESILTQVDIDKDSEEKIENICDLFSDMLQNRRIYYMLGKNGSLVQKLFKFCFEVNYNKKFAINSIKILIKLLDNLKRDMTPPLCESPRSKAKRGSDGSSVEVAVEDPSLLLFKVNSCSNFQAELELSNYIEIFENLYNNLDPILFDFSNISSNRKNLETTFGIQRDILGSRKLEQLDYFKAIFELITCILHSQLNELVLSNIYKLLQKFMQHNFVKVCMSYFFIFEYNNIYQAQVEKLFTLIFNKNMTNEWINHIFDQEKIIEEITSRSLLPSLTFKSGTMILPAYFPLLCEVLNSLNLNENSYVKIKLQSSDEWRYFFNTLIKPARNMFYEGLLSNQKENAINLDSPFQKFISFTNNEKESTQVSQPLKQIYNQGLEKYKRFLERKEKDIKEDGTFVKKIYLKIIIGL